MSDVREIIDGYISHNPGGAEKIIGKNYVVISVSALTSLGREIWRAGAGDVKEELVKHIKSLPLEKEFCEKLVKQVGSVHLE